MVSARRSAKFRVRRACRSEPSPNFLRCWNGVAVSRSRMRMGAVGAVSPRTSELKRDLGAFVGSTREAGYTPRGMAVVAGAISCSAASGRSTGDGAVVPPRREGAPAGSASAAGAPARWPRPARSAAICPGVRTGREETRGAAVPAECPASGARDAGTRTGPAPSRWAALRSSARAACSSVGRGRACGRRRGVEGRTASRRALSPPGPKGWSSADGRPVVSPEDG